MRLGDGLPGLDQFRRVRGVLRGRARPIDVQLLCDRKRRGVGRILHTARLMIDYSAVDGEAGQSEKDGERYSEDDRNVAVFAVANPEQRLTSDFDESSGHNRDMASG